MEGDSKREQYGLAKAFQVWMGVKWTALSGKIERIVMSAVIKE